MATKKNPLSALLKSDERQQAEELRREHVTRSAVRQAGTYGVGVQQPLPISQTSLGRLSNSLGTVSGILNQFSQYQSNKEKAELQGEGLQHQLNMQEIQSKESALNLKSAQIQGGILNETVKQQVIQLDRTRQQVADAEFDLMMSSSTPTELEAMQHEANEQVRRRKAAADAAALGIELANPGEHTESPLYGERALRHLGGAHAEEYAAFHAAEVKKKLDSLRDHPNGTRLSREEALDLAEKTMHDFMEMRELDPNGEVGKGFLQATERLRAAKTPELANRLLEESEKLNTQNLVANIKSTANDGGNIEETEWFAQLNGMSESKALAALFGSGGDREYGIPPTMGVMNAMVSTPEGAVKFQMLFDQMAEKLLINGKPFKEYRGFDTLQAKVEEAVENAAIEGVQKEEDAYRANWKEAQNEIDRLSSVMTEPERALKAANLITADETVDQLREKLLTRFPSLAEQINKVPDDMLHTFAGQLVTTIKSQGDAVDKTTASLIATAIPGYNRGDERLGAQMMMLDVKKDIDTDTSPEMVSVSALMESYLTGQHLVGGIGLENQGGGYLIGELDKATGGLFSRYTSELNAANRKVQAMLPDNPSQSDFNTAYAKEVEQIDEKLKDGLKSFFLKHHRDNVRFKTALALEGEKEAEALRALGLEEGFDGAAKALLLDETFVTEKMRLQPHLNWRNALELAEFHKKLRKTSSVSTLSETYAANEEDAKTIGRLNVLNREAKKAVLESYTDSKGKKFSSLQSYTNYLSQTSSAWRFKEEKEAYNELVDEANGAAAASISAGLTAEDAEMLGSSAYAQTQAQPTVNYVPKEIVYKLSEDYLAPPVHAGRDHVIDREKEPFAPPRSVRRRMKGYNTPDTPSHPPVTSDWTDEISRDVVIPGSLFRDERPPITDIPFGSSPPASQEDANKIAASLGWSKESLRKIHFLYGYDDPLTFLQDQYYNNYYFNRRLSGAAPIAAPAPTSNNQSINHD